MPWKTSYVGLVYSVDFIDRDQTYRYGNYSGRIDLKNSYTDLCPPDNSITPAGLILGLRPANERRRYKLTPSLIGWVQT